MSLPDDHSGFELTPWGLGWVAHQDGLLERDNPYDEDSEDHCEWLQGLTDAEMGFGGRDGPP